MEDSKASEPVLPFVWPVPDEGSESRRDGQTVPLEQLAATASSIVGIVSDIDAKGVELLATLLLGTECRVRIVLAVHAGCPTRFEHLTRLLEIQDERKGGTEFRILPMALGIGARANCLTVVTQDASTPICLFGNTPNFGIPRHNSTQLNMAFRPEPVLTHKWCGWFDRTWSEAARLTEATARIPKLVPAPGSVDADALWRKYCRVCSGSQHDERRQEKPSPVRDANSGASAQASESKRSTQQSPSAFVGLNGLDRLAERVVRLLGKGQQATVVHTGAIGPLDVPINAHFFDQDPEKWNGTVVRRQSFRISAFSKEDQKMIDEYRKSSRKIMNQLALPFEKGLYWMPYDMIPIFKKEIAAAELEAKDKLDRLVNSNSDSFVDAKRAQIRDDLEKTYRDLGGKGELPRRKLDEVVDLLARRIHGALESAIVTPVSFYSLTVDLHRPQAHEAPWKQMEKLILALARFPRRIILRPNLLSGIMTTVPLILDAMDVENDALVPLNKQSEEKAMHSAEQELELLDRIAESDIVQRDRCEVYLMIIDGKSNADIHEFINRDRSEQQSI